MNTQSNTSRVSVEAVAFLAAIQQNPSPRYQLLLLDSILDAALSMALSSHQRQMQIHRILASNQNLVEYTGVADDGLLDSTFEDENSSSKCSSSKSTSDVDEVILWMETCKRLQIKIISSTSKLRK